MSKIIKSEKYRTQNLKDTWSYSKYRKYEIAKNTWGWHQLPFGKEIRKSRDMWSQPPASTTGSILEIGSASGGAYAFMEESKIIDLSDYTGMDISELGHTFAKDQFPLANWVQADVITQYEPDRNYDYTFERIAIHHMPEPLSVIDKFSKVTNKAFCTSFVSCLNGDTISDLSVARYRHPGGDYVFFDIINVFQVMEVLYQNGFNNISLRHSRLHESVYHDSLAHQYLSPDVNWKKRIVARCTVYASKSGNTDKLIICPTYSLLFRLNRKAVSLIESRIKQDTKLVQNALFVTFENLSITDNGSGI